MIEEDWQVVETPEHRGLMMKNVKFASRITIICASFMYGGGFCYHLLIPLTAESIVTPMNITVQPFPSPAYGTFFTNGLSPIYELVFIAKVFTGFMNDTINVLTFSLFAVLILHTCGQLDVLMMHLHNLVSTTKENHDVVHGRLVMIIKHHLRVLSFISRLENLLTEICLIEVLGSTIIICLLGYYFIVACNEVEFSDILAYGFLIMSFTFNLYIYCFVGELLTSQEIKVGETVCLIDWYNLPRHTSLDLILLIRITQFPAKITAGKFTPLSLNSFASIMRTSAAYFNFVWRMTQ